MSNPKSTYVNPVKLISMTEEAEAMIVYCARVSNPKSQVASKNVKDLIRYLIRHNHWSPFEMAHAVIEINTSRTIARQILQHRSFSFQEFSQRYADVNELTFLSPAEVRTQDTTNRQSSHVSSDELLNHFWVDAQTRLLGDIREIYSRALTLGIAKEVARAILPEGLTPSRMYMAGSIRSWIHYCAIRTGPETQKEHREVACAIQALLATHMPNIFNTNTIESANE